MADPVRATPLSHRSALAADDNSLRIHELPFADKHILRADHAAVSPGVIEALGLRLPVKPLTSTKKGNDAALWLGPDEWLLLAPDSKIKSLADGFADTHAQLAPAQLTCVSDYYTTIGIEGPNARFALSKLTTLDLHPRAWRAGMVGGSLFGQANGWLWLVRDTRKAGPEFRLFVRWSHADYLWCLLANAGRQWGMPVEVPVKGETLLQATAQSLET